ncbi:MAG: hypothetical protein M1825_006136 [Sarcosagium campestre]|nr:MAG: hypothetical protein M1825_006136 [Sarcosagium campestre]
MFSLKDLSVLFILFVNAVVFSSASPHASASFARGIADGGVIAGHLEPRGALGGVDERLFREYKAKEEKLEAAGRQKKTFINVFEKDVDWHLAVLGMHYGLDKGSQERLRDLRFGDKLPMDKSYELIGRYKWSLVTASWVSKSKGTLKADGAWDYAMTYTVGDMQMSPQRPDFVLPHVKVSLWDYTWQKKLRYSWNPPDTKPPADRTSVRQPYSTGDTIYFSNIGDAPKLLHVDFSTASSNWWKFWKQKPQGDVISPTTSIFIELYRRPPPTLFPSSRK